MRKIFVVLVLLGAIIAGAMFMLSSKTHSRDKLSAMKDKVEKKRSPSVDHAKFDVLKKNFATPQEVTAACLTCHTERGKEVMASNHFAWEREEYVEGRGVVYLGKKNALNNFCIGTEGNEKSCAKCHVGYGMDKKDSAKSHAENNIDCLICHDNTETYAKAPEKGGAPMTNLDLMNIAQHVGKPKRSNCGVCHFFGGGGNNVKHGDLDKAQFEPSKEVDVHMASKDANLQCVDCHKSEKHNISGKMYSLSSMNRNRTTCESCHTDAPHKDQVINDHGYKVACQTCHIPTYAKKNATKMEWDWSTAGKLRDGKPYEVDDKDGNHTYLSIKGSFKWAKNVEPEYVWFNGTANHYLLGDKVEDPNKNLELNPLGGSYADEDSKIIPVKVHRAKQPFDPVTKMVLQPKLYSDNPGEGAFWKDFNWSTAAKTGMEEAGLPASGEVTFINTSMNWTVNHQVATKEKALKCVDCHNSENSRLKNVKGFYMPARDKNSLVEATGFAMILLTLMGVISHGLIRLVFHNKSKNKGGENED